MTTPAIEVLDGGLMTTVQDGGRPDWAHVGVPTSGAADPWSLAIANLLLGNSAGDPALEMTINGPTLMVVAPISIALAGADLGARVRGGRPLGTGQSHRLAAGDIVEIPGSAPGSAAGCRGYLSVPGGIDVPIVLGSRSTCLPGGFGGLGGRPLAAGDAIAAIAAPGPQALLRRELAWPADEPRRSAAGTVLRVIPARADGIGNLLDRPWRVAAAADRVGIRLDGDALPSAVGGETTTHGVPWGAIQVPPGGQPIILGPDHQVTGGYAVVGVVCSADRGVVGQLGPGAGVRFVDIDRETAVEALREQMAALRRAAAVVRESLHWEALLDAAGS